MKIEAVLLDMDGTLINSEPAWLLAEEELMAEFGYTWTSQDQAKCLGGPLWRVGQYMSGLASGAESPEFFEHSLVERVEAKFHLGLDFMAGGEELLVEISAQNIPMALVSASTRSLVQAALDSMSKKYFNISISSNDVTHTKPDPESYLTAAQILGVDIEECLILEDSKPGVASALAAGGYVIAIPHLVPIDDHPRLRKIDSIAGYSLTDLLALFS